MLSCKRQIILYFLYQQVHQINFNMAKDRPLFVWLMILIQDMVKRFSNFYFSLCRLIYKQAMGNSSLKPTDFAIVRSYRPEDWIREQTSRDVQIWKNKQTQDKVEVYGLQETPSMEDMSRYQLRMSEQHIVKIYHIAISNSQMFCVASQFAQLLVEHIPIRLSEVEHLDIEEALTILHSALKGFHSIDTLFGHVKTSEDLIGFNYEGKPKVWLNRQFNLNFCEHELKKDRYSQAEEVKNIFRMIDKRVTGQPISDYVRRELLQNNLNFLEASQLIQEYTFREQLSLRRYVRIDLLQRQLGTHRKMNRYSSAGGLLSDRFNIETKDRQFQVSRIQSCRNITQKQGVFQLNHQTEKKCSIDLPRSQVVHSPMNHGLSPRPKITFNQSTKPACSSFQFKNIAPLSMVKEVQRLDLSGSCHPAPARLQKMSANQISFKVPHILARSNNFVHPHRLTQTSKIVKKELRKIQLTQTQLNEKPLCIEEKEQMVQKDDERKEKDGHQMYTLTKRASIERQQHRDQTQLKSEQREHSVNQKRGLESEQTIIDKISRFEGDSQDGSCRTPAKEIAQFEPMHLQASEVAVSGVFSEKHHEVKYSGESQMPPMIVEERQEQDIKAVTFGGKFSEQEKIKRQIPINFQSFGVSLISSLENISFAPKIVEQGSNGQEMPAQTSKSVNIEEEEEEVSSVASKKTGIVKMVESGQEYVADYSGDHNLEEYINRQRYGQYDDIASQESKHEESFQEVQEVPDLNRDGSVHPLYQVCTSVQSKFHILFKKDSNGEHSSNDHSNRLSAFAQTEDQEVIKSQFKNMFQEEGIRVNRVSSEYEMLKKQYSQPSHTQRHLKKGKPIEVQSNANLKESQDEEDFLDVKFLQKSLDLKIKSMKKKNQIKELQDQLNISKLDEKLQQFSASKISESCSRSSKMMKRQSDEPSQDQTLVNNLITHSESNQKRKLPSIEYHTSVFENRDFHKQNSVKGSEPIKPKIEYYQSVVSQQQEKQFDSTTGYKTAEEDGFTSLLKEHRSLEKDTYDFKHKTYDYGESMRKNTQKRQSYTSLNKDSSKLLEERYQKYVKQPREQNYQCYDYLKKDKGINFAHSGSQWQKRSQNISPIHTFKEEGQRISYNHLRSFLRN